MTGKGGGRGGLGLDDPERENAVLLAIIEATATGPGVEPLAAAVAKVITDATATDVCFVHVLDDTDHSLTLAGATPPFDAQVGAVHLPFGQGVAGWVASLRRPVVIIDDKRSDPRYLPIPELRGEDFTSMVSVPMTSEPAGLAGVLNLHTRTRREFDDRDVRFLLAVGGLLAGAVHHARMHRSLRTREQAHERFSEQLVAAQESERGRLAREIHDGISQRLVSLSYHLDAALTLLDRDDPRQARADLESARDLAGTALGEARTAIGALRPPVLDDLGLGGALAALARDLPVDDVRLELDEHRLPEHVEVALYRIAQEALQNVQKHARAADVAIRLDISASEVRLAVTDDGVGFDVSPLGPASGGYGLASVRERADLIRGTARVESRPGSGTTLTVTTPLASPNDEEFD